MLQVPAGCSTIATFFPSTSSATPLLLLIVLLYSPFPSTRRDLSPRTSLCSTSPSKQPRRAYLGIACLWSRLTRSLYSFSRIPTEIGEPPRARSERCADWTYFVSSLDSLFLGHCHLQFSSAGAYEIDPGLH
ncbi:hypothetical protein B0H19DRAFT_429076 [Mycena capillaripes]|nr:hypothetical protein B0H19DRAFT_429076 [Mycena capillaripes]